MIQKKKQFFLPRIFERVSTFPLTIKKAKTRLKLRRRGSFADSSWTSLLLRPVLEWQKAKTMLTAPLFAVVVAGAAIAPTPDVLEEDFSKAEISTVVIDPSLSLQTEEGNFYFSPVAQLTGISQYFKSGHPGLDMRAPLGTEVLAMEKGVVKKIVASRLGYGRHVYLEHRSGLISLYAHLGLITVEEGEEVLAGEKIGEVGMTGWTTGPHLHFEVHQQDRALNPMAYVAKAVEEQTKAANKITSR